MVHRVLAALGDHQVGGDLRLADERLLDVGGAEREPGLAEIAVVQPEHRHLTADADQVPDRRHDRHGDEGLAAAGRDEQVDHGLHQHHADGRQLRTQLPQRQRDAMHDGVQHAAVLENDADTPREADQQRHDGQRSGARSETAARGGGKQQRVWVLKDGQPVALVVSVGPTDGAFTAIYGREPAVGTALVVDTVSVKK